MDRPLDFNREKDRPPLARSRDDMDLQGPDENADDMRPGPNIIMGGPMSGNGPMGGRGNMNGPGMMGGHPHGMMGGPGPGMMNGPGPGMMNMGMIGPQLIPGHGNMNTMGFMGGDYDFMMGDPSMMGAPPEVDGKEILHFNGFIMVPPPHHAPPRSTREKPPGCKTVFIGGLPETVEEDMIGELMQTCGNIETIRFAKKHFAHVRFVEYEAVDKAIFYSGWRMKIAEKDDKPNTGRIHCDYATARDDQYEWDCMQRAIEREQRHQRRMLEDMHRPPSPPQVVRYSDNEASNVSEMLKSSQGFADAAVVLTEWLDKGYVSSRNANRFYTMIQSINSSVRRITADKEEFERELMAYKLQYKSKVSGLLTQMEQIQTVFIKARQQKVWDHFSKPQRKNVELWTKQCKELKEKHNEDLLAEREEDEMELSDHDDHEPAAKKSKIFPGQMNHLKDENDSLKCQLEAYKNELDMNKQDSASELIRKNKQITMLQQTLKGMQEQLMSTRNEVTQIQKRFDHLKSKKATAVPALSGDTADSDEAKATDPSEELSASTLEDDTASTTSEVKAEPKAVGGGSDIISISRTLSEQEGQLLALIVCFLHVHPFGASMDYIWSYLQRGGVDAKSSQIESLLESFPNMFTQKMCGIGVNFEKRWVFTGFPANTGI